MRQIKALYPIHGPDFDLIRTWGDNTDFEKAVGNLRKKWDIDVSAEIHLRVEENKDSDHWTVLSKNKKFVGDVLKLQKAFSLGEEWSSFVEEYIFVDTFAYRRMGALFIEKRTKKEADTITGKPVYYLRIFPETTEEDIVDVWPDVNDFIHGTRVKPRRKKRPKKAERDYAIYQLAKAGDCIGDIENHVELWYPGKLDEFIIRTAVARYAKSIGVKSPVLHNREDMRKRKKK